MRHRRFGIIGFLALTALFSSAAISAADEANRTIAVVLGNPVFEKDIELTPEESFEAIKDVDPVLYEKSRKIAICEKLYIKIIAPLLKRYAEKHNITATKEEVAGLINFYIKMEGLQKETPQAVEAATKEITMWKVARSLHQQYGGRGLYGAWAVDPVEANRHFVERYRLPRGHVRIFS